MGEEQRRAAGPDTAGSGMSEHTGTPVIHLKARRRLSSSAAAAHVIGSTPACTSAGPIRGITVSRLSLLYFQWIGCPPPVEEDRPSARTARPPSRRVWRCELQGQPLYRAGGPFFVSALPSASSDWDYTEPGLLVSVEIQPSSLKTDVIKKHCG